jgi:hypothetical protein
MARNYEPDPRPRSAGSPLVTLIALLLLSTTSFSVHTGVAFDHSHRLLTEVLNENVARGRVDYQTLKSDPDRLDTYLRSIAEIDPNDYRDWTRQKKLALWINAYNAYTLKAILDHYPIEHSWIADPLGQYPDNSIRQIPGVWDELTWSVMGKQYTLNKIEHGIIRQQLADPRIHFVLVCASVGCPYLENRAFEAAVLNERLDQAGYNYIYESRNIRIDRARKVVSLPQIFDWFKEDFEKGTKYRHLFEKQPENLAGILSWIYRYANEEDRKFLLTNDYRVTYLYYDWALNE